jgi:hypothetical protein
LLITPNQDYPSFIISQTSGRVLVAFVHIVMITLTKKELIWLWID